MFREIILQTQVTLGFLCTARIGMQRVQGFSRAINVNAIQGQHFIRLTMVAWVEIV